jgi:Tat protein translocase TatB subunit
MDFFGIGFLEILAVLLVFAIVFGPHRLPEIAGQFGRAIRELREYARDFRDEYLTDFEEVREEYLEVRHDLEQTDRELRAELQEIGAEVRTAVVEAKELAETGVTDAKAEVKASAAAVTDSGTAERATADASPELQPAERPRGGARHRLGRTATGQTAATRPGNVISIKRRRTRRP